MDNTLKWLVLLTFTLTTLMSCSYPDKTPEVNSTQIETQILQWDDRSVYSSGLITGEQDTLNQLPGATVYHIYLVIADEFTSLSGSEIVHYTNCEETPLNSIKFQLYPNQLGGSVSIANVQVNGKPVSSEYLDGKSAMTVTLPTPLQPGESTQIDLAFSVELPTEGGGNYGLFGYIDKILVLDGIYPSIPVYDELGWHAGPLPANADTTFNDVSFYLVQVTAPANLTLVASGVEVSKDEDGNRQVTTFAAGPARDFYLAASSEFVKTSKVIGETTVNSYALSGYQSGSDVALITSVEALQDFSRRYGAYPYTEFDVVSTPMQGATGIEYPGVVGINKLIYADDNSPGGSPAFVALETTVAHEVGHQWFYNMVGNDQANEPWVDESLTQYITGIYFLDEYGQDGMNDYTQSWVSRWSRVDMAQKPIGLPAADYQGSEYSAIVYGRGPIFLQTLADTIGQPVFDELLLDYAQKYRWQISNTEGFKHLAEAHCQCDLNQLFSDWVYNQ